MASLFFNVRQQRQRNVRYQRIHPSSVFQQNDRIFYSKYRFRREDVKKIVRMLEPLLPDAGLEPWEISKEDKVLITLRYLATNSHQIVITDCFGVCQKASPASSASGRRKSAGACGGLENSLESRNSKMSLDASMVASSESSALSTSATTTTAARHVAQSI
ncbi:unnamed protein product [Cylicocyclus nassatus]|uniref:Uncharacterized protein n=1 Tax=Cylicocyclus nassatus TaxID=53992 RepID=A0AA36H986_CYLNA|nr:unnamed protein product [Cylicocyclus nassatus]